MLGAAVRGAVAVAVGRMEVAHIVTSVVSDRGLLLFAAGGTISVVRWNVAAATDGDPPALPLVASIVCDVGCSRNVFSILPATDDMLLVRARMRGR